jgi:formylglycine-generating enzyme required for sulfatase activity
MMGSGNHDPEEATAHRVTVGGLWIDEHAVTNREFAWRHLQGIGWPVCSQEIAARIPPEGSLQCATPLR